MRAFIIDNALRWLRDFHIDALRLDAVHALLDDSPRHLLAELSDAVADLEREVGRPLSLIAESDLNDVRMVTPTDDGGLGMTAQWDDDVHHALHALLTGERHGYYADFGPAETLVKALRDVFVHDGTLLDASGAGLGRAGAGRDGPAPLRRLLPGPRPGRQPGAGRPAQPGALPRPAGRRAPPSCCSARTPRCCSWARSGARRTPFLYFTDHEPELGELVRQGRTAEFGGHGWAELYGGPIEVPDPQSPETFAGSPAGLGGARAARARPAAGVLPLAGRGCGTPSRTSPPASGPPSTSPRTATWLVMHRGALDVVVALADGGTTVPLPTADAGSPEVVLAWGETGLAHDGTSLTVQGPGVAVLRNA